MAVCSTTALRKYLTLHSNIGQPLREGAIGTTRGHAEGETSTASGPYCRSLFKPSVGVLVRAALPGAVRVAEVDLHASIDPQLRVLAQLRSLIPGQRASQVLGQGGDRARDGVAHRLSPMPGERGPVLGAHAAAM